MLMHSKDLTEMGLPDLIEQLKTIPDWRRGRKVQHPLWVMLLMSLLGAMSGYTSLRGLADFMLRHREEAAELLGLSKAKLPSYSTLQDMAHHVDAQRVAEIFHQWAMQAFPVEAGQVISMDGKALGSTVQDDQGHHQDFVRVVSACVQQWDGVIAQVSFQKGENNEIESVRPLLEVLDVTGVWFTPDALHTQKNGV